MQRKTILYPTGSVGTSGLFANTKVPVEIDWNTIELFPSSLQRKDF